MMRRVFYHCATAEANCLIYLGHLIFSIFFLLVPAVLAGLEPSTLGWWGKCSTIVLLLKANCFIYFGPLVLHFLPTGDSSSSWTQTLNLGMIRQVFYHCATAAGKYLFYFVDQFLAFSPYWCQQQQLDSNNLQSWDDDASILPLCCHCYWLIAVWNSITRFLPFSLFLCQWPWTLGWWGECSAKVMLLLINCLNTLGWNKWKREV